MRTTDVVHGTDRSLVDDDGSGAKINKWKHEQMKRLNVLTKNRGTQSPVVLAVS